MVRRDHLDRGGVSKRLFTFPGRVETPAWRTGPAAISTSAWSASGSAPGCSTPRLSDPSLSPTEGAFLEALSPVFTELEASAQATLYVDGTARLLAFGRFADVSELNQLMDMLERRVALLEVLAHGAGGAADRRRPHRGPRTRRRLCARSPTVAASEGERAQSRRLVLGPRCGRRRSAAGPAPCARYLQERDPPLEGAHQLVELRDIGKPPEGEGARRVRWPELRPRAR